MADISVEIATLQMATTGEEIRSAMIAALEAINAEIYPFYSGAYTITPSTTAQTLSLSGFAMASNLTIEAYALASKMITSNGTYYASDDSVNGFSQVTVAIPAASKLITDNGTYYASDDSVFGYSQVTVALPLASKLITSNGIYDASTDSAKGYSTVTVSLSYYSGAYSITPSTASQTVSVSDLLMSQDLVVEAFALASKSITSNGTYYASSDGVDGFSIVEVAIPLASKVVTANGIYYASSDSAAGYSVVTVSIPYYSGAYTITPGYSSQTLSTSGCVLSQNLVVEAEPIWEGTQSEYNALSSYDSGTTYFIIG